MGEHRETRSPPRENPGDAVRHPLVEPGDTSRNGHTTLRSGAAPVWPGASDRGPARQTVLVRPLTPLTTNDHPSRPVRPGPPVVGSPGPSDPNLGSAGQPGGSPKGAAAGDALWLPCLPCLVGTGIAVIRQVFASRSSTAPSQATPGRSAGHRPDPPCPDPWTGEGPRDSARWEEIAENAPGRSVAGSPATQCDAVSRKPWRSDAGHRSLPHRDRDRCRCPRWCRPGGTGPTKSPAAFGV